MYRTSAVLLLALVFAPPAGWAQGHGHGHPQPKDPMPPEFRLNTYTTGNQAAASVASPLGGFGPYVVVWSSDTQDGSGRGIIGRRAGAGAEFRVNTYTTGDQFDPSVAVDGAGNCVVVWTSPQDGSGTGVFGQRYASTGAPLGPEFRVNTYTTGTQYQGRAAADSSGFAVVWSSLGQDGSGTGVFGQRYDPVGVPVGAEFRVNTFTAGFQYRPAVSSSLGHFVVVWQDGTVPGGGGGGAGLGIFGQRYAAGVPAGPQFQVETYTTGFQGAPDVVVGLGGEFVVVWHSDGQDGSDLGIFGQRFAGFGAPIATEFRVNTYTTGSQGYPALSKDGFGCFLVVWSGVGQDDPAAGIFGQLYWGSAGDPLGFPEWRFNTYTTATQAQPSVAGQPDGTFVVAWDSQGQDGSGYGVFGGTEVHFIPVELMQFGVE